MQAKKNRETKLKSMKARMELRLIDPRGALSVLLLAAIVEVERYV